jgi:dethiobiotin synthetase
MKGLFVTGTDTGVGKTVIAGALVAGLTQAQFRVAPFKPVAAGCAGPPEALRNEDALTLSALSGRALAYDHVNPVALEPPIAPHIAAAECGVRLSAADLAAFGRRLAGDNDVLVVEGAGGWLVPLEFPETMADLAAALGLPVVLVVGMRLGCLNHALLTARAVRASGLPLAGWVGNLIDPQMPRLEQNLATLSERLDSPCLGRVPVLEGEPGPGLSLAAFAHIDLDPLVSLLSKE